VEFAINISSSKSVTISVRPDGVGAVFQPSIVTGEQFGLLTRIATMDSGSLCTPMKSGLRFWNWKGQFVSGY